MFGSYSSIPKIENQGNGQNNEYIFSWSRLRNFSDDRCHGCFWNRSCGDAIGNKGITIFRSSIIWHKIDDIFTISRKRERIGFIAHIYTCKPLKYSTRRIPKEDINLIRTSNRCPSQCCSIIGYRTRYISQTHICTWCRMNISTCGSTFSRSLSC